MSNAMGRGTRMRRVAAEDVLIAVRAYLDALTNGKDELVRIWDAIQTVSPWAWRYMPDECAIYAAAKAPLSPRDRARCAVVSQNAGHSPGDAARHVLEWAGTLNRYPQIARRTPAALLVSTFFTGWRGVNRKNHPARHLPSVRYNLALIVPTAVDRIANVSDERLIAIIKIWGSKNEGRPRKNSARLGTKWDQLVRFAREIGIRVNADSLKKASAAKGRRIRRRVESGELAMKLPPMWKKPGDKTQVG